MGILRKAAFIGTAGVVSSKSKDDRSKDYGKQTRNAARAQVVQNAAMLELQRQQLAAMDHGNVREEVRDMRAVQPIPPIMPPQPMPQGPPPGWYPDAQNQALVRWYDGTQWTQFTQPNQQQLPPPAPQQQLPPAQG